MASISNQQDQEDTHISDSANNESTKFEEIQNFVKCHKAIQELCLRAAACVENVLNIWHARMREDLRKCASEAKCKNLKGQPNEFSRQSHCKNCCDWADEIVNAVFPQDEDVIKKLCWKNVSSPQFHQRALEVAKVFVYNTPKERVANISDFTKFDSGSLLMIMKTFSEFLEDVHQHAGKKERSEERQDELAATFTLNGVETNSSASEEKRKREQAETIEKVSP